ncbi:MAG: hypothetical protein A3F84_18500 [Candidatus Handelsmanbacteria bacterium RIFCSPLOWO2_12_FULL_64_10]|uniref:NADH:quinone oxidoreductase/Mrp antiporter transmembrane domain-containing protein n=1 Tax=Handelsmanbacteria sp. (strain RIFCSPLOWO2_12_FULL_64_10) TaxID=1817868 RepID=A0A1F6D8B5_HANXR|nr:MAG: hypothetical protein A3F84_18500 [Candidatus Handelsmanbacteria bacterium RIFCSPLOWO2_12_FULL_64_10]
MTLVLVAVAILLVGAVASLAAPRAGAAAAVLAGALGIIPALAGASGDVRWAWSVPGGEFHVAVDGLSAFFLIPIFGLSALAAVYGVEYLARDRRPTWIFYNLLVAGMVLVVISRNAMLFLVAWEVMALASYFLVARDDEPAGRTFLIASHLGTAFLLVMFVLLGRSSLDFDSFAASGSSLIFLLAVVGFGTKAGFVPFHVWLPEAHPAAPSHVSAVMSGVMIKTGIYGLVRTLTWLGEPPFWWGWLLAAVGAVSALTGIVFALAQRDLKRMLAYSSVENVGIIALGLGIGMIGQSAGLPAVASLGYSGAMLHVINHALFKGLLFLGAGAVLHATGTRELERMGGLLKRMPVTGATFLVGAAAICGLPALNGFVSEFLILTACFHAASGSVSTAVPALAAIAALALVTGLVLAGFTRAFGVAFLGEPRTPLEARDPGPWMRVPMLVLAAACAAVGLGAPWFVGFRWIGIVSAAFLALVGLLALARRALLKGRPVEAAGTWDCGYVRPTARMQYTASSFAQPITEMFALMLRPRRTVKPPEGLFPGASELRTETPDLCREKLYGPLMAGVERGLWRLRWMQQGHVHLYVLYIALTLVILMVWKLG